LTHDTPLVLKGLEKGQSAIAWGIIFSLCATGVIAVLPLPEKYILIWHFLFTVPSLLLAAAGGWWVTRYEYFFEDWVPGRRLPWIRRFALSFFVLAIVINASLGIKTENQSLQFLSATTQLLSAIGLTLLFAQLYKMFAMAVRSGSTQRFINWSTALIVTGSLGQLVTFIVHFVSFGRTHYRSVTTVVRQSSILELAAVITSSTSHLLVTLGLGLFLLILFGFERFFRYQRLNYNALANSRQPA
jgi:hypothetical protein